MIPVKRSNRFYWCTGCGQWHDPHKDGSIHYAMFVPMQRPTPGNFDGTPDELARFLTALELKEEDAAEFEARIDRRIV